MPGKLADPSEQYIKNKELKQEDVEALREWAKKQPHLPTNVTELQLILFLISCNYSMEMAKTTIDNFYTVRTHYPEVFNDRDPSRLKLNVCLCHPLPLPPSAGHDVLFCIFIDADPSNFCFNELLRVFDMYVMSRLVKEGTSRKAALLIDCTGFSVGHLTRLSITSLKTFLYYMQEACPIYLEAMHFINAVPLLDTLLNMMKPFIKTNIINNIHVHSKSIDSLYEFVPKEALPEDYGGKADSISTMAENMKKQLLDYAEYFKFEEQQVVDESKRLGKSKAVEGLFGIEGTFKKLEID